MENLTVKDFNSICRLCLNRARRLKPIFKSDSSDHELAPAGSLDDPTNHFNSDNKSWSFVTMLTTCFGLKVISHDLKAQTLPRI